MNIIDEIVRDETLDSIRRLFEHGCELEKLKGCFKDIAWEEIVKIYEEVNNGKICR